MSKRTRVNLPAGTVVCPACKGTKKVTIVAQLITAKGRVPQPPVVMDCYNCSGRGYLTAADIERHKREAELWCDCKNSSGSSYQCDTPDFKHHWTCNDCGRITQIG